LAGKRKKDKERKGKKRPAPNKRLRQRTCCRASAVALYLKKQCGPGAHDQEMACHLLPGIALFFALAGGRGSKQEQSHRLTL